MTAAPDNELVDAARNGSDEAFGELVDRYQRPLVRLAYRLTRDSDEAHDIAQDAFLRAYRRIEEFAPDRPFSRWLFVIARNASLDTLRRKRRLVFAPLEDGPDRELGPEDVALQHESADTVRLALEDLPPNYRRVLELYYVSQLRYREIALELDIPIGTVKTYISRAKRRLRDRLETSPLAA